MTLPFALLFIASGALHLASAFAIAWLLLRLRRALRDVAALQREREAASIPPYVALPLPRWTSTVGVT